MKLCFLYPGQGAQYPGMGKDLYEKSAAVRDLFGLASEACGLDTARLLFDADQSELKDTKNTQIAITLMNLSVRRYLAENGITSSGSAGFSLGEWSAYVDAGVLTEEEIFPIVMERGAMMARSAEHLARETGSGMAAVIGLEASAVETAVASIEGAFPANYNSKDQTVISGTADAVAAAGEACKQAGARRVIPLKVSGPFHTPLMKEAQDELDSYLSGYDFRAPQKTIYSNVSGRAVADTAELRQNAVLQVTSPVRWTSEEEAIEADGYDLCIECGPGKVLTGLWKKTGYEINSEISDKLETIDTLIEKIQGM